MFRRILPLCLAAPLAWAAAPARAGSDAPPPVPANRTELKQALENSKRSTPRLPLPPVSDEDRARAKKSELGLVNNGRMRQYYLPKDVSGGGFLRGTDPAMSLGYPFQTMLFWVVSRGNNCTYCMGHQESKLALAGVKEDVIAALDGDWSEFTPGERAAFAFANKLTHEPHAITSADLDRLRPYYKDAQILEAILVVGNFNAMNRWTGALRIPQEEHRVYLTETAEKFRSMRSRVAPLAEQEGVSTPAPSRRPALESRSEVEAALSACRARSPRLPLVDDKAARAAVPADWDLGSAAVPQWVRLLATFPVAGPSRVAMHRAAETRGKLDNRLKAEIAWVAARHDRAWYALADARRRLHAFGLNDDQIFALDDPAKAENLSPLERATLAFAKKLTVDPALITDGDVAGLRALTDDFRVAEIIHQVTEAAFFDRLTEAAGLAAED
ncbi:MAG: hypothetical protein U0835_19580 [Isosphaeraceae bacterium]